MDFEWALVPLTKIKVESDTEIGLRTVDREVIRALLPHRQSPRRLRAHVWSARTIGTLTLSRKILRNDRRRSEELRCGCGFMFTVRRFSIHDRRSIGSTGVRGWRFFDVAENIGSMLCQDLIEIAGGHR